MASIIARIAIGAAVLMMAACGGTQNAVEPSVVPPLASLSLTDDGLGDVLLGFPPDVVIGDISALFGEPDLDSDWVTSEPNVFGSCPGLRMRAVGWGSLVTIFINDSDDPLGERFYSYTYGYDFATNQGGVDPRGLGLTTDAGIGIGSTVAELEASYKEAVVITGDAELDTWSFEVEGSPFRGLVTGPDLEDTVTLLEHTPGCS